MTQGANTRDNVASRAQTSSRPASLSNKKRKKSSSSTKPFAMSSSSPRSDGASTQPTTPESSPERTMKPKPRKKTSDSQPGASSAKDQRPTLHVLADPRIASYTNRGIHLPLKEQRGKQRPAGEVAGSSGDSAESAELEETPPERPVKKLKLKPLKRIRKTGPAVSSTTKSKKDLLTGQVSKEKQSSKSLSKKKTTELAPSKRSAKMEAAPPPPAYENDELIRCVCGMTQDDGAAMICCDDCGVWQHNACMGEAVPVDLAEGQYRCEECDPALHGL